MACVISDSGCFLFLYAIISPVPEMFVKFGDEVDVDGDFIMIVEFQYKQK